VLFRPIRNNRTGQLEKARIGVPGCQAIRGSTLHKMWHAFIYRFIRRPRRLLRDR
jgi:hypothetical protein